ncbi:adenylate kinase [candidate division TA06 bacterium]|uniref:Adenylate kinase n=1 Tax=candidate division TA06 bacterium TaxID=2250710 RepID=A0A660SP41_UNCT6|nr:MAG: adenylate kinase [candidate division TA06 bacterium]
MNIILLGPPGVGKGTQAVIISKEFNLYSISTGDILRESIKNNDELGKKVKNYVENGALVPDNLIIMLINQAMNANISFNGFLFDGFPRTVQQAKGLDVIFTERGNQVDTVLAINADNEIIMERLLSRRICPGCGMVYNLITNPPRNGGKCDICNLELTIRKDDNRETILHRLEVYRKRTAPLLIYYKEKLIKVNGAESVSDVADNIIENLVRYSNARR